ncbi:DJ-1/PfpI family protein [Paremcibacter congregatus]|uniref:Thiamine biosynthesis protein ThiJ n=1 Tax=Paremcibacter congregatus TaxID=2043170 RepID=A0A2G4YRN9_9PROT|nr:DJ-1/PfpI family protein [Paremcibacter congregatus]PHZ84992.1 thiamine biosynthesis protein ThiJ [Paremcibacter congregatus]QDE26032.1 DJ-1/PfpI family protein [Paremcibacter congregatus]|tara:strand:+ start:5302 stop:5907 length:606 start_codon:yes stop_codon:yes gene_type:complete
MFTIGIILFDDFEELDAVGPWEVFRVAQEMGDAAEGPKLQCEMTSLSGNRVMAKKGMEVIVDKNLSEDSSYDLILLPGGAGSRALLANPDALETIRQVAQKTPWVTSVCSGSLVYAAAGLLAGKKCTSHHSCLDFLAQLSPTSEVVKNHRFVRDGAVITSAGVSAGIDMALWVVGEIYSPAFARQVQHYLEYYPDPPYQTA